MRYDTTRHDTQDTAVKTKKIAEDVAGKTNKKQIQIQQERNIIGALEGVDA